MSQASSYLEPIALKSLPEAVIIVDSNGLIRLVNSSAVSLLKISDPGRIEGAQFSEVIGEIDTQTRNAVINSTFPHFTKLEWIGYAGNRRLRFQAIPLQYEGSPSKIGTLVLIRDDAVEEKATEILNLLFHELLMPLSSIKGYSSVLLSDRNEELTERQRDFLSKIKLISEKLIHFRQELLETHKKHLEEEA